MRRLADLEEILTPLARILELRRRSDGRGWEVVMAPPVNRVLPVSEERTDALRERFA